MASSNRSSRRVARLLPPPRALALSVLCLALLTASGARAQDAVGEEELERFKLRVSDGKQLFEMGKFRAAIEQFQAARDIYDHPRLTFNIAQAYKSLGACSESRDAFTRYLGYPDLDEQMRARAAQLRDQLDTTCVEVGRLRVSCAPADAELSLTRLEPDATRTQPTRRACPLETEIRTGQWEIVAHAPGYDATRQQFEVTRDATQSLHLNLSQQPGLASTPVHEILAWSLIGAGGLTLVGGIISDVSAVSRLDELGAAQTRADRSRIDALQAEADSAHTRTAILYSVGALAVAGGVLWLVLQPDSAAEMPEGARTGGSAGTSDAEASQFSVDFGPAGVQTQVRW